MILFVFGGFRLSETRFFEEISNVLCSKKGRTEG